MNPVPNLVAKHILWKGLYYFSALLVNIFVARFFGAAGSGHVFYIVNNLSFVLLILSGSMESGSTYFAAGGQIDRGKIAWFCLAWTAAATLVFAGCLILFGPSFILSPSDAGLTVIACCLFVPGVLLTTFFTALFYAKRNFFTPNFTGLLVNGMLIILLLGGWNLPFVREHFLLIYFSGFFLQGIVILTAYFLGNRPAAGFLTGEERARLMKYGSRALLANVLFFLVGRVDYWFVERFCSGADLGNYIQASKLAQMFLVIPSTTAATLFPVIASSASGKIHDLKRLTLILVALTAGATIILAVLGRWFFPLVFGPGFGEMHLLFVLLIPGILALTAHYPLAAYFSGRDRISVNIAGSLAAVLLIVLLDLLLLPRLGVAAASCVSSAGYGCYFLYLFFVYRKEHKPSVRL
jgi:O-antigen/teichoic acid export membrane protein